MDSREKALLVLSPGFPENEADTSCLPAQQQLVSALSRYHPDIKIILIAFQYPFVPADYLWHSIRVIALGGNNRGGFARLFVWIKAWSHLLILAKRYKVIGILSFWFTECAFIGKLFGKWKNLKQLSWILGQDAKKGNKYVRWARPREYELVAISDFISDTFSNNFKIQPAHIIPNAIDPSLFPKPNGNRDIDIIGVGSLIPLKRFDLFIDIIHDLSKKMPRIQALLCGKGPEKEKLEALIIQYGLTQNIRLTGELPYVEVLKNMQHSKLLLHPSAYEGFSGVCLEALYAGAHVVSFCSPAKSHILHWHIAADNADMFTIAENILYTPDYASFYPVLPCHVTDSANAFMQLYR